MADDSRSMVRARALVVATAVASLALTLVAWQASRERERRNAEAEFGSEAAHLTKILQREIDLFTDVLESLGRLHTLSDRISAEDFEEFATKGMQHTRNVLGAFGFAQLIPEHLRDALEHPPGGGRALIIVEPGEGGGMRAALERPEFFPLTYQNPPEGLGVPDGFDFLSLPGIADALSRMGTSGRPVLGADINEAAGGGRRGHFVLAPVEATPGPPAGFTVAILWPQDVLGRVFDRSLVRDVQVTLYDAARAKPAVDATAVFVSEQSFSLVDQPWILRIEAMPSYLDSHGTAIPWFVLAAGLVVSALLTLQTAFLAGQTARVMKLVRLRTGELEAANRRLSDEMQERLRLEAELDETAARERLRIGQDLHDSLGQKLTGAVYLGRSLAGMIPPDGEAHQTADKMIGVLKDAVAEVRQTARGINPVDLGENGLAHALHRLAEQTCATYPIACSFRSEGEGGLPSGRAATHLYYMAREAVTNAVRHAAPRNIDIRLDLAARRLTIRNDGTPFAHRDDGDGSGLRIMRHRAQQIGATVDVGPGPSGGTLVEIRFA